MPTATAYQPILDQLLNRGTQNASTNVSPVPSTSSILGNFVPGMQGLTSGASNVISNLLQGQPSPNMARRANAYFGASSGMPNSDFVRNRGFDLYNQESDQRQQRGVQDFLSLLSGFTPLTGQQNESNRFNQNLAYQDRRAAVNEGVNAANTKNSLGDNKKEYSYSTQAVFPGGHTLGNPEYRYKYYA